MRSMAEANDKPPAGDKPIAAANDNEARDAGHDAATSPPEGGSSGSNSASDHLAEQAQADEQVKEPSEEQVKEQEKEQANEPAKEQEKEPAREQEKEQANEPAKEQEKEQTNDQEKEQEKEQANEPAKEQEKEHANDQEKEQKKEQANEPANEQADEPAKEQANEPANELANEPAKEQDDEQYCEPGSVYDLNAYDVDNALTDSEFFGKLERDDLTILRELETWRRKYHVDDDAIEAGVSALLRDGINVQQEGLSEAELEQVDTVLREAQAMTLSELLESVLSR